LAHFSNIILRIDDEDYDPTVALLMSQWKPPGAFLILDTTEMSLIRWTILMSPGGRTRDDDTSRPFKTYAATLDGSWPTESGWSVNCQSGFLGSTGMSRHDPGLLQTLRLLRQMTWLRPSRSLLYMSSAISIGVIRFRLTSRELILGSHPIVNPPAAIPDYAVDSPPRHIPPYEEVHVEQKWARHPPNPYQIISNISARVDGAMAHPNVFHNLEEVIRLMHRIQSEWSMLEQMSAPQRRSRSPRAGPV